MTPRRQIESELERSRQMLDGVMANVPDFVLRIDRRGRIVFINRVAKGLKMENVLGSSALGYVSPGDKGQARRSIRRAFEKGEESSSEVQAIGDDGRMRCYFNRLRPIREKGRVTSALLVATDITDRRAAEESLKESRESYRLLFEANPNPMVVSDLKTGRYLAVNEAAIKHYGYSREEWLSMSFYDIRPPDEAARLRRYHKKINRRLSNHGVWRHRKKDGALISVDITASTIEFGGRPALLGMLRDVTVELQTQEALRRSREYYRSLFEGHPLPMWVGDYETLRILAVNDAAIRTFGYTREEFLRRRITALRRKKELPVLLRRIQEKKPGMSYQGPSRYRRKDGSCFDAEVYVSDHEFEGRKAFVVSVLDLSEDLKAQETQARFYGLFNSSRDGLSFVTMGGTLLEINDALCRMLGYRRDELVGRKTFIGLTAPEHHAANRAAVQEVVRTGEPVQLEKEYIRKDGTRLPAAVTIFRVNGAGGACAGTAAIVRDITERKHLEKEILEIGAREQSRLGRELHDSLGQHLTGMSFLAESLKARLSRGKSEEARMAERIARAASGAVEQVKALAAGLVPAELLPNGLPAALQAMAAQAEKTFGLECAVRFPRRLPRMEEASLLHLYRIAQEAVSNAAKHSRAKRVTISLREKAGRVLLEVLDDGRGIGRRSGKGLGLKIMAHRAQMLGGAFEVRAGKDGGTTVSCSCPVARPLL